MTLGFLVALELASRHYGEPGPLTASLRETVLPPDSGGMLYAALALTMLVLTWRRRWLTLAAAIGIDLALLLVRWAAGIGTHGGHPFGNGALWAMLGWAVIAVRRRTGSERALLLKGVGLGLILLAGRKTGDTWLFLTARTRPTVLDPYVATADQALGNPSWLVGRLVTATGPVGFNVLDTVYGQLAVAAVAVALFQLRHVAKERRFPRHHLIRTFLVIGVIGPAFYLLFPVVGPLFAYGTGTDHWAPIALWAPDSYSGGTWAIADIWPHTPPPLTGPHPIPFDEVTPRNCMPSLHTAWATAIFVHSRQGPRALRWAGTFWLVATLTATLGFGYHYGVDLIAGVVLVLTVEAGLRAYDAGRSARPALLVTAYGTLVLAALLLSYRLLPLPMAHHPWLFGPLLLLAMLSVIYAYVGGVARPAPTDDPSAPRRPRHEGTEGGGGEGQAGTVGVL